MFRVHGETTGFTGLYLPLEWSLLDFFLKGGAQNMALGAVIGGGGGGSISKISKVSSQRVWETSREFPTPFETVEIFEAFEI